jgi:hypothetical protein
MLDLSEESKEENIETCVKYFKRMAKMNQWLEMEIGITGGEEDGVDNSNVDNASLYTQPEDIFDVYKAFAEVSPNFSIAAAFGNVHGVYKVSLRAGTIFTDTTLSGSRSYSPVTLFSDPRSWASTRSTLPSSSRTETRSLCSLSSTEDPDLLRRRSRKPSPTELSR